MINYHYDVNTGAAICGIYEDVPEGAGPLKSMTAAMTDALVITDKNEKKVTVKTPAGSIDLSFLLD